MVPVVPFCSNAAASFEFLVASRPAFHDAKLAAGLLDTSEHNVDPTRTLGSIDGP